MFADLFQNVNFWFFAVWVFYTVVEYRYLIIGSYLLELHTLDDFNAFQEWMYDLKKYKSKSTGWIATGAEVFADVSTNYTYQLQVWF